MKKIIFMFIIFLMLISNIQAQQMDALSTKEFLLEKKSVTYPSGREFSIWTLCLNGYRVLVSGQKRYIPIFPIYSESCFKTSRDRSIDVLERASNALDSLLHGETLEVLPAPENGNFSGFSIWAVPHVQEEHPGLVFRIDDADLHHFGFRAENTRQVANYVKNIFEVMRTLFLRRSNPSNSPAMQYPDVKILKRIWLDARQHAEKIRNIPPEKSAYLVTFEDIQEAIDMLSESQKIRLLGIAFVIPEGEGI